MKPSDTPRSPSPAPSPSLLDTALAVPAAESLRRLHDLLASEPHRAGSPGDQRVAGEIAAFFREQGLAVEEHEFAVRLPRPIAARLSILSPDPMDLPIREAPVEEDPWSSRPGLDIGWNAYCAGGEADGTVVYANYGRKEDFATLAELGTDLAGKIVLARYGENFRGHKARFAEEAGAAGLVIYTDPQDDGYVRGLPWPEGGFAGESHVQRGSLLTLPVRRASLRPLAELPTPRIPVQPVGFGAAREILSRMKGRPVPEGWQGGLPFTYRVTGGERLRVRLAVEQGREDVRTRNVVAMIEGRESPGRLVIAGAHHDAWVYGAGDPLSGTVLVLEAARSFARAARSGLRPRRSLAFAAWAAEEYGMIGSGEWIEAHRERLAEDAVAYLNLDMATMGPTFRAAATPSLAPVIREAFGEETRLPETFDDLGGGSDHVGFACHLGVPSAGLGTKGAKGVSYHSVYDNLAWYRKVVTDDYAPARMLTRGLVRLMVRLADDPLLPLDPTLHAEALRRHLAGVSDRAAERKLGVDLERLSLLARAFQSRARETGEALRRVRERGGLEPERAAEIDGHLLGIERSWVDEGGLPGRPWLRNLYAAPDEDSGYAPWLLPGLRAAVEHGGSEDLRAMRERYVAVLHRMEERLAAIADLLG